MPQLRSGPLIQAWMDVFMENTGWFFYHLVDQVVDKKYHPTKNMEKKTPPVQLIDLQFSCGPRADSETPVLLPPIMPKAIEKKVEATRHWGDFQLFCVREESGHLMSSII